ncbi:MAG: RNA polymerase sigma factor [Lachnospiraceae bacterium]|nr:RNA polymerase sigma factor [Lachnospiraceae bacterium]
MYSDFLLIQKVKNGNEEAGEWLVKKYYASIYQYCFLHVRNRDYAEDLTQDTFVRFFEALGQYKNYGKTKSYLYCIAGNIIKNYYKKKKELLIEEFPEIPENNVHDMETRLDIEQAVDHLPEELKETAILFFFQELKQREIADLLNINVSLVKYRISRAKKILSECLEVKSK